MRLTVSGHAFEIMPLEGVLAICHHMGFKGVDISGFHNRGRVGFEPEDILADPQAQADRLTQAIAPYDMDVVDFFPQFGVSPDHRSLNDPDPAVSEKSLTLVRACADFCQRVGIPGMTILPGVDHTSRTHEENLKIAGQNMRRATEIAAEYGVEIRFEPHMGSVTHTPELAVRLVEEFAPQAKITVDYSHFILQYIPEERCHVMLPYAGHVHIRPARPGKMQTSHAEGTIDFPDMIRRLKDLNYQAALSVEYVCQEWFDGNQIDTLHETVVTKEALQDLVGRF